MAGRQTTDVATAFLIGALFGVGATLLMRGTRKKEAEDVLHRLRRMRNVIVRRPRHSSPGRRLVDSIREYLP